MKFTALSPYHNGGSNLAIKTYLIAAAAALSLAGAASAATVGFDDLKPGSFTSVTSDGYVLTGVNIKPDSCSPNGKPCLGMKSSSYVTMSLLGGGAFNLESLWVKLRGSNLLNNLIVTAFGGVNAGNTYEIKASDIGRNTPTVVGFGSLFTGVDFVSFTTNGDVRVDDIVATASPIPLPAAGWALLAGLGGLAAARRKRH